MPLKKPVMAVRSDPLARALQPHASLSVSATAASKPKKRTVAVRSDPLRLTKRGTHELHEESAGESTTSKRQRKEAVELNVKQAVQHSVHASRDL